MKILLTIAWRNIRQHKAKTAIIGLIMIIGITILVVGNSLMDSASAGIEKYYTKNYTGHLVITGSTRGKLTLFGYEDMTGMEQSIPRIPDYTEILEFAHSLPYIEAVNPQISTSALVSHEDEMLAASLLFGIMPDQYREMFPDNLELLEGNLWEPGEEGVLLSKFLVEQIEKMNGTKIRPGDKLIFTSMGMHTGMKIREVEITGIFSFKQSNLQLDMVSLMDVSNARALEGMVVGHTSLTDLSEQEQYFLGDINQDSIFESFDSLISDLEVAETSLDEDYWFSILGETETRDLINLEDTGAWQYLVIRLRDEKYLAQAQADFASFFAEKNISAQTWTWLQAAGSMAELSRGIKNIFNGVVFIIAIVAIIIIMNTLVIAIIERMGEIGTMRAIGAQKRFVRRMVLWETLLLSGISGSIGILLGALVLAILKNVGLEASNVFFEIIFGGKILRPELSISSVIMSLVVILIVGIVSSTYPTAIVMRTSPLKAMESSR